MNAETIKDFLVSLGFDVDEAGSAKFEAVLTGVTANALKLGVAVEASALAVVAFTAKIASGLDNLYWASQRTGATVQGIQQIGYAISQTGGSAEAARGSLESLSRFMRNNPGAEGFLNRLGVQTRDASGNMRDMASVFTGVGQKLSSMPYYRANQYAQMLGIDENTLMAMRRGMGQFSAQYSQMTKAIGYNADQAALSANKFTTSLTAFSEMAGMARDKIGSNLAEGLAGSIDNLRRLTLENFPKVEEAITRGVKGILWLAEVIGRVIFRFIQAAGDVRDWWATLDKSTQQLIATLGGLVAAWRILNSAFLKSPIGIITLLALAIIGLYDDYKTWKEGGKSLIDWGKWEPDINSALENIDKLTLTIKSLAKEVAILFGINPEEWSLKWEFSSLTHNLGELGKMLKLIGDLMNAINDGRWSDVASIGKQLLRQGSDEPDAMPGITSSATDTRNWFKDKYLQANNALNNTYLQANNALNNTYLQANNALNEHLPGWAGGAVVRQPQPTKDGAVTLGWLQPTLAKLEQLYRLPEGLLRSVALAESNGNQFARGPETKYGQAKGMFQIIDGTAKDLGLKGDDVFDPVKSAQAAAKYLSQLLEKNNGDLSKALASYNWGAGNVQKHGMALMPRETREYIPKVMSNMPAQGATIQQETNINIHGVSDPMAAASEVAQRQTGVNSRLTQSLATGPR